MVVIIDYINRSSDLGVYTMIVVIEYINCSSDLSAYWMIIPIDHVNRTSDLSAFHRTISVSAMDHSHASTQTRFRIVTLLHALIRPCVFTCTN